MWPLAPLQISWRRGTHRAQWGSFCLQRRARPRAPNNALGTVGAPSIPPLLPLPLLLLPLLFLLSFTPLPLTVRPPSLTPLGPRDAGGGRGGVSDGDDSRRTNRERQRGGGERKRKVGINHTPLKPFCAAPRKEALICTAARRQRLHSGRCGSCTRLRA